jgi:hypothetical protein
MAEDPLANLTNLYTRTQNFLSYRTKYRFMATNCLSFRLLSILCSLSIIGIILVSVAYTYEKWGKVRCLSQ